MGDFGRDIAKYVIYFLLGIVFTMTWVTARDAQCGVIKNNTDIAVMQNETANTKKILEDMSKDIKTLLMKQATLGK